jgi:cytochrome c peroxidase
MTAAAAFLDRLHSCSTRSTNLRLAVLAVSLLMVVPGHAERRRTVRHPGPAPKMSPDCKADQLPEPLAAECRDARLTEGKRLFESETFGGNGRTCATCHSAETGTFSTADVQNRLAANRNDPLFLHDALDDGLAGTSRIERNGTIRVTLPIPSHLKLISDPSATHVTLHRGTPTTKNTPALDTRLMWDLRDSTLTAQALGAIRGHAQSTIEPTPLQLELIAEFQRSDRRFFSSEVLWRYAQKGAAPVLPEGTTESEKRGRLFFVDTPFSPPSKAGICALCHSGPMLNESNRFSTAVFGSPAGVRIFSTGVSERNLLENPVHVFEVRDGLPNPPRVATPDPGILMSEIGTSPSVSAELPPPSPGLRLRFFASFFKIPTLWGVKDTAPYFHDNSSKDLDEMLEHYNWFFENGPIFPRVQLTPQEIEDIKAYMQLL